MKYELYSGAGNDFVMINNITEEIAFDMQKELTKRLCSENFPLIDGVIFADKPINESSVIRMNYYNRDGSFGAMCGNGARCISMFVYKQGITDSKKFMLEALGSVYSAEILNDDTVTAGFPEPKAIKTDIKIEANTGDGLKQAVISYVNVGSDHIVMFVNDEINKLFLSCSSMDSLDVNKTGRLLRFHKEFEPAGGNVNFAEILTDGKIRLRTYERGVERETLACGTGIISAGIIAMLKKGILSPVRIKVQSGEELSVNCRIENGRILDLSLTGSAKKIGVGSINIS